MKKRRIFKYTVTAFACAGAVLLAAGLVFCVVENTVLGNMECASAVFTRVTDGEAFVSYEHGGVEYTSSLPFSSSAMREGERTLVYFDARSPRDIRLRSTAPAALILTAGFLTEFTAGVLFIVYYSKYRRRKNDGGGA